MASSKKAAAPAAKSPVKPTTGAFKPRPLKPTNFRFFYERGDFPIALSSDAKGNKILWKVPAEKLDYQHYLPLFFDGLSELQHPYAFFAEQGVKDLVAVAAETAPQKVLSVIPQLIIPLKNALNTRNAAIMCKTLKIIQFLVTSVPGAGESLVPYYRQILPMFNTFKSKSVNTGDGIDYSQAKKQDLGALIGETLETLERYGGPDAFINIKYMIPTYESVVLN
eukprot:m.260043 g.260043  ORF g.260043 m.260043 type:complete len:223 (+) comp22738_c0_seq3:3630-4298(+)